MTQMILDECLTPALRAKIKKLVELNLDTESIWDLLDPNLKSYEDYMYAEVEKYVKYVLWLRETDHSLDNAYEKYKNYTQNFNRNFKRDLATRLELEQKRKDQQRIDELSALMRYSRQQKSDNSTLQLATETSINSDQTSDEIITKPIIQLASEKEDFVQPEIKEENNDEFNDVEDTESDLDFIDLANNQHNEPSITLNTKDLLFETMTHAATEVSEVTIGLPLEEATINETVNGKTLMMQNQVDNSKTNEALAFYQQLEAKYGDENLNSDLPLPTYSLGSKINYQKQEYLVKKIETVADFFNNPEMIITLQNVKTGAIIHVNRKQLESEL